jgi:uncharacterized membrane-anchored protein
VRASTARVAAACAVQLALVAGAVAPQLSARLTGEQYRLAVAPVDPIDPFRGAYVDLSYPGLQDQQGELEGTVFVPLTQQGEVWQPGPARRTAPPDGPFLRCNADGYQLRCGIESLFASQPEARRLERELAEDGAVAVVKIDDEGHASIVRLEAR